MKRIYFHLLFILALSVFFSCSKNTVASTQDGNWVTESQLNGPARSEAVSFVIGNFAYLGTGWDGLNTRYTDFWRYDNVQNVWSQVVSMPDTTGRSSAIAFAINNTAYVGTGYDGFLYLKDMWQLDLDAGVWTKKSDFVGSARYEAVAFGLNNLGFVGTGFDGSNALKDFYSYDPSSDAWTDIGFSGNKRYGAVVFTYSNKAYLVTGVNSGTMQNDFWVFDPASTGEKWSALRNINNYSSDSYDDAYISIARWNGSAFVIGDFAYISTGENGVANNNTWQYQFNGDQWLQRTPFVGPPTTGAVGFSVGGKGYISTGRSAPGQAGASDYLRQFQPNITENPNDN